MLRWPAKRECGEEGEDNGLGEAGQTGRNHEAGSGGISGEGTVFRKPDPQMLEGFTSQGGGTQGRHYQFVHA